MSDIVVVHNEKDLFVYFQKARLEVAKELNDLNVEKTKNVKEEKPTFKGVFNNLKNSIQRGIKKYDKKDNEIASTLEKFNNSHPNVINDQTARELVISLFQNDKYGLSKLVFASTILLDDEYDYKYNDDGLAKVSTILYGNKEELATIKTKLEKNYKVIASKELSGVQKGLLIGVAAAACVGVIAMPILLGAGLTASGAATTTALAAQGFGDMQLGLGVITAKSLLVGAAVTGIAYGGMKLYNDKKVKEEFLSLSPEKHALYLAIQCTYIERVKETLSKDEFKEQLDSILRNMNILKSDLDYYLFVEHRAVKDNKEKVKSFHEFDNRLCKVLGL